jgi:hypothetical protein
MCAYAVATPLLTSSSFSTIQLSVGEKIAGLQFLFGHEIQRRTLQKFADL